MHLSLNSALSNDSSITPTPLCTPWNEQPTLEAGRVGTSAPLSEARLRKIYDNLLGLANHGVLKGPVVDDQLALGLRAVGCELSGRAELAVFVRTVERARAGRHVSFLEFAEEAQRAQAVILGAPVISTGGAARSSTPRRASAPVSPPPAYAMASSAENTQVGGSSSSGCSPRGVPRRSTVGEQPQTHRQQVLDARGSRIATDLSLLPNAERGGRADAALARTAHGPRRTVLERSDDSDSNSQDADSAPEKARATSATSAQRRRGRRAKSASKSAKKVSGHDANVLDSVITIDDPQLSTDEPPPGMPTPGTSSTASASAAINASAHSGGGHVSARVREALTQLARLHDTVPAGKCQSQCKDLESILNAALRESANLEGRVEAAEAEISKSRELTESGLRQLRTLVDSTVRHEADAASARGELAAVRAELQQYNIRLANALVQRDWMVTKCLDRTLQAWVCKAWRLSARTAIAKALDDRHHQSVSERAAVAHCAATLRRRLRQARRAGETEMVSGCRSGASLETASRVEGGHFVVTA